MYGAALDDLFHLHSGGTLGLRQETLPPTSPEDCGSFSERLAWWRSKLGGLRSGTEHDFVERNQFVVPVGGSLPTRLRYRWLTLAESDSGKRWSGHGPIAFSRIGYSADSSQALIYVSDLCPLCGSGSYVLLKRSPDGHWVAAARVQDWIS